MRTEAEVREALQGISTTKAVSPQQALGVSVSKSILEWVLQPAGHGSMGGELSD